MNNYYTGVGSRDTPADRRDLMTKIARFLNTLRYTLRSGGADGADLAFEAGAGVLKEIYLPWKNFNGSNSDLYNSPPEAEEIAKKFHPVWHKLKHGARALHTRNVHQVLGKDLKTPTEFVVCWTSDGKASGGTGQAMRIATHYCIPIYNLYNNEDEIALKLLLHGIRENRLGKES